MARKVLTVIKLQIPAGAANPAPPVGPALGQHGVNIMEFCKAFNAQTQTEGGTIIPVEITVYEHRPFDGRRRRVGRSGWPTENATGSSTARSSAATPTRLARRSP